MGGSFDQQQEAKHYGPCRTRDVSPVRGPSTPPKHSEKSKRPWIVADWKHRVPEPSATPLQAGHGSMLHTAQRAALVAERRMQLESEFACVQGTIDRMLSRCSQVQQQLGQPRRHRSTGSNMASNGGSSSSSNGGCFNAPQGQHMHLTARSRLLFAAPAGDTEPQLAECHSSRHGAASPVHHSHAGSTQPQHSGLLPSGAASHLHHNQQQLQQQLPSVVDLNPGICFRPGTPQRDYAILMTTAAGCGSANAAAVAGHTTAAADFSSIPGAQHACGLTHREMLQAGIQVLQGEFYGALKQQQYLKQHACWERAGAQVIPASWFRP